MASNPIAYYAILAVVCSRRLVAGFQVIWLNVPPITVGVKNMLGGGEIFQLPVSVGGQPMEVQITVVTDHWVVHSQPDVALRIELDTGANGERRHRATSGSLHGDKNPRKAPQLSVIGLPIILIVGPG